MFFGVKPEKLEYTAYVIRGGDCQSSIFHLNKLNMFHGVLFFEFTQTIWIIPFRFVRLCIHRSTNCVHTFFYLKKLNHTFKLTYKPSNDSNELNENAPFRKWKIVSRTIWFRWEIKLKTARSHRSVQGEKKNDEDAQ